MPKPLPDDVDDEVLFASGGSVLTLEVVENCAGAPPMGNGGSNGGGKLRESF